ncbi:ABC transporter ATP-binding protein [Cohnella hongkongensis]|uniref:ABC transporter ATP-binding protein n=1 Tax=Cohnella hongkongensis TaxID=178337 RepID=A0ABV9FIP6_9BACL
MMEVTGLSFGYARHSVLSDIRMKLAKGEVASIVGPNGAGKTTLLKSMAAIFPPEKRRIWVDGQDVRALKPEALARKQAYVPQQASFSFPLTVMETVLLGRKPYMRWRVSPRDLQVVEQLLNQLKLEAFADRYMDELSGGERQKVLIARALAQEPEILLLDEPTSALDIRHQLEVLELIRGFARQSNMLVVLVLHDLELAARYSDTIHMLYKGKIYASGTPEEVFVADHMRQVYGVHMIIEPSGHGLKMTALKPVQSGS